MRKDVLSATKLHETTSVPILAPGNEKTKTGSLWILCVLKGVPRTNAAAASGFLPNGGPDHFIARKTRPVDGSRINGSENRMKNAETNR